MKLYLIIFTALLSITRLNAQNAHFTTSGVIEFEKKVNMYGLIKNYISKDNEAWIGPAFESYKKTDPQFKVLKNTLSFSGNKTFYAPVEEEETSVNGRFSDMPLAQQINTVYTDLNIKQSVTNRKVFDELFLIKDSTRRINWKITDETRDIAGYTCRRANAVILDSIYVVAFYTGEIPVAGGPESFTGLPGMILGIALPHEYVTWFATRVTDKTVAETVFKIPVKGKAVNNTTLKTTLINVMKDWGDYGKKFFRVFLF